MPHAVTETIQPRSRKVKILATLGPASSKPAMIRKLVKAGADAFRVNMSHGDHKQKAALIAAIRALEKEFKRPTTILVDLQGPKLRVGHFKGGSAELKTGDRFILDRDERADHFRGFARRPERGQDAHLAGAGDETAGRRFSRRHASAHSCCG